jgi:hypothetical protein
MDGIKYEQKKITTTSDKESSNSNNAPTKEKVVRVMREPSYEEAGITIKAIYDLFRLLKENGSDRSNSTTIKCSFLQIYQENVFDLLADSTPTVRKNY